MQRSPRPSRTSGAPEASNPALLPETPTTTPFATDASRRPKRTRAVSVQRTPTLPAVESEEDSDSEQCVTFEGDEGLDVSFPLKAIEKNFRCSLCSGYFRDAVTIKECLHTFCRWCLYDYVDRGETEEVCCPYCERNMQLLTPHRDGEATQKYHLVAHYGGALLTWCSVTGLKSSVLCCCAICYLSRSRQRLQTLHASRDSSLRCRCWGRVRRQ